MIKNTLIFITLTLFTSCVGPKVSTQNEILKTQTTPEYLKVNQWNLLLDYFSHKKTISNALYEYIENIYFKLYPKENREPLIDFYFIKENQPSLDYISLFYTLKGGVFSVSHLKMIKGEHELAAIIAFGKERSKLPSVTLRGEEDIQNNSKNADRLVHFLNEENILSIGNTVDVLYHAGYDLRSLLSVLSRIPETPDHKIEQLKEMTQKKIFNYPPLVNPLLRTAQYYLFQKEIESL